MSDAPPAVPPEFQVYNSYVVDPTWQRKFSIVWASVAGAAILLSLPRLIRSVRNGQTLAGVTGVWEDLRGRAYEPVSAAPANAPPRKTSAKVGRVGVMERALSLVSVLKSCTLWTAPLLGLGLGEIVLVVAYYVLLLLCITLQAELVDNPNRAGFMAIAQLPVVFLLATKNSPLSLLLGAGHGWEKLNYLHRWSGRGMFLAAAVHGSLWIRNHLQYGLQILGPQKETSGVAAFALLGIIVLSSLKFVRVYAYQVFFIIHILAVVAFFVTLCYHTIYAKPYIFPPLAFYGLDLLLRLFRFRVKDATLIAVDKQMTIIRVHDCDGGWTAGQHVRLRVFFAHRVFESHPLTIMAAPAHTSCLASAEHGRSLLLGVRVRGDWSRALNTYARTNCSSATPAKPKSAPAPGDGGLVAIEEDVVVERVPAADDAKIDLVTMELPTKAGAERSGLDTEAFVVPEMADWTAGGAPVQVMLDGPYGGCALDLGDYARVLLVAGGSGITFTLGLLDDLVGRCARAGRARGERTRRVEFAWCIKSFGALRWVAPLLTAAALRAEEERAGLELHITVFVTCLCDPGAVPPIPGCDVILERPRVGALVGALVHGDGGGACCGEGCIGSEKSGEKGEKGETAKYGVELNGGGLAICAAGPERLTREVKNAAARLALTQARRLGQVTCHTEVYSV